jgi:hypothetical protein
MGSWNMDALKAGSMAIKNYAWYWTIHQKYSRQNYDVKDSTADQVYVPGTATTRTDQAVEETWNWTMTKNGQIFEAQYDSGTPGSPDPLYAGRMSQWGTQYWATSGKDWQWILHNYYDPTILTNRDSACSPNVTFNIYIDPAGFIYDTATGARISEASVWLQQPDGQGGWQNVSTGQIPAIMHPDMNPLITGVDGQYQWDVLNGSYRVHVEAPGYYPADSIVVSIPPPVTDLQVGLTQLPVTPPVYTITPPVITNVSIVNSTNSAGITWDTDKLSDSLVKYGTSSGNYPLNVSSANVAVLHSLTLNGLTPDTLYYFVVNSTDTQSNTNQSIEYSFRTQSIDTTPPTTNITLVGTIGNNSWYTSNVTVSLTAADDSGINKTEYSFDNTTWNNYTTPFNITNEGVTTVYYHSSDNAGNVEPIKSQSVKIDKTAPQITISIPINGASYTLNQLVTANWQATDSVSGIASVIATVPNGTAIDTSTTGTKTFSVNASDNAGNQAAETVTYNITSTSSTSKNGSISGMKFNDLNHDGIREANESGLANWTITLTNQTGGVITTKTNTTGNYIFTNLTDGNYTVGEVQQNGWNQTAPVTRTYNVTITGGAAITGKDFGNFQNVVVKCDNKEEKDKDNKKLHDDTKKLNDDTKKLHDDTVKKVDAKTIAADKKKVDDDKKKVDDDKKKLDDDDNKCKDNNKGKR